MTPLRNLLHPKLSTLVALQDGEVSAREARRLEGHLARCRKCRSERGRIAAAAEAFARFDSRVPQLDVAQGVSDLMSRIAACNKQMADGTRRAATVREQLRRQLEIFFGSGAARLADSTESPDAEVLRRAHRLFTTFLGPAAAEMVLAEIGSGSGSRPPFPLEDAAGRHAD